MDEQPKISFCITCKGRLHHLKKTLRQNLTNAADYPNVEFVVLDYDSQDGLGDWIKQNYQAEMDSGKIRYARVENKPHFHMAHAKNMSHRAATGDILVNLDADNIIAPRYTSWLAEQFAQNPHSVVRVYWQSALKRLLKGKLFETGLAGRIAINRDDFMALRGYDERIDGWGGDDCNIEARAVKAGLKQIKVPEHLKGEAIEHDDASRTTHMRPATKEQSDADLKKRHSFQYAVRQKFRRLLGRSDEPVSEANIDGHFGCGTVTVNFKDEVTFPPANETQTVSEGIEGKVSNSNEHRRRHATSVTVSRGSSRART